MSEVFACEDSVECKDKNIDHNPVARAPAASIPTSTAKLEHKESVVSLAHVWSSFTPNEMSMVPISMFNQRWLSVERLVSMDPIAFQLACRTALLNPRSDAPLLSALQLVVSSVPAASSKWRFTRVSDQKLCLALYESVVCLPADVCELIVEFCQSHLVWCCNGGLIRLPAVQNVQVVMMRVWVKQESGTRYLVDGRGGNAGPTTWFYTATPGRLWDTLAVDGENAAKLWPSIPKERWANICLVARQPWSSNFVNMMARFSNDERSRGCVAWVAMWGEELVQVLPTAERIGRAYLDWHPSDIHLGGHLATLPAPAAVHTPELPAGAEFTGRVYPTSEDEAPTCWT